MFWVLCCPAHVSSLGPCHRACCSACAVLGVIQVKTSVPTSVTQTLSVELRAPACHHPPHTNCREEPICAVRSAPAAWPLGQQLSERECRGPPPFPLSPPCGRACLLGPRGVSLRCCHLAGCPAPLPAEVMGVEYLWFPGPSYWSGSSVAPHSLPRSWELATDVCWHPGPESPGHFSGTAAHGAFSPWRAGPAQLASTGLPSAGLFPGAGSLEHPVASPVVTGLGGQVRHLSVGHPAGWAPRAGSRGRHSRASVSRK